MWELASGLALTRRTSLSIGKNEWCESHSLTKTHSHGSPSCGTVQIP